MTTDTPRMDAIRRNAQSLDYDENGDVVMLEDARTLERERDGWKEREAQAHRLLDIAERELAALRAALEACVTHPEAACYSQSVYYAHRRIAAITQVALAALGRKP